MADTVVNVASNVVEINNVKKYQIHAVCLEKGDLPDAGVFLLEIVDPLSPTNDEFERVIQVADLDALVGFPFPRTTAVNRAMSFYRATEFYKMFDDAELAGAARQQLLDNVNTLVSVYTDYGDEFVAPGTDYTFPTEDETVVTALKAAYDAELAAYDAALATQTSIVSDLAITTAELDDANTLLGLRTNLYEDFQSRASEMLAAKSLYSASINASPPNALWFVTQVQDFLVAYDTRGNGVGTEAESLRTAMTQTRAMLTSALASDINGTISTGVSAHDQMNADEYYDTTSGTVEGDLTAKQNAVTSTQTAKVIADADVTAKYGTLANSYAAVKSVCPDWTPDTPLPPIPSV